MTSKFFVDSNILLYLIDPLSAKHLRVNGLLEQRLTISVQVLNECANVARKKSGFTLEEIREFLQPIKQDCFVAPVTIETHERALQIAQETNLGVYDANIVAAAELAGCDVLYTEDLNHSQRIGRVTICNPFMAA